MKHGLGRIYKPDTRDRLYPMSLLMPDEVIPTQHTWPFRGTVLDQGQTGTCVGNGWEHFLHTAPIQTKETESDAVAIYQAARTIDSEDPNDLQSGSTVRAGAKALVGRTQLASYLWSWNMSETAKWVLTRGPVVLGTNWYDSMFDPDPQGLVKIPRTATLAGGHCYLLRGVDTSRGIASCLNSWGPAWGLKGHFSISFSDLERLIHEDGEVCAAIQQKVTALA